MAQSRFNRRISNEDLARLMVAEMSRQMGDDMIDNLGDTESIVFMGECPTLNVVELAASVMFFLDNEMPLDDAIATYLKLMKDAERSSKE